LIIQPLQKQIKTYIFKIIFQFIAIASLLIFEGCGKTETPTPPTPAATLPVLAVTAPASAVANASALLAAVLHQQRILEKSGKMEWLIP
jgi:hypothetical protein